MDELTTIQYGDNEILTRDAFNPSISHAYAEYDLFFYQTRDTLQDPERYRSFLKSVERQFRASDAYKMYKARLMNMGMDHCQIMGNISAEDSKSNVEIELHHNIINLFDICILISKHVLNTVGLISSFDLIHLLIEEHFNDNVGCTFLSVTAHEMYTNDPYAYIPPDMTWGKWWVLLDKYKYGITYDIAKKVIEYINKYNQVMPVSIDIHHQEEILNFAYYNDYGVPRDQLNYMNTDFINQHAAPIQIEAKPISYLDGEYRNVY